MRILIVAILYALFWQPIGLEKGQKDKPQLRVTIALEKMVSSPSSDLFRVICMIENIGDKAIRVVEPTAYSIEPHPWIQKLENNETRFWSGSEICATYFTQDLIVELKPNEKRQYQLPFGTLSISKNKNIEYSKLAVRYSFNRKGTKLTKTMDKVSFKKASELESSWSNEIAIPISQ